MSPQLQQLGRSKKQFCLGVVPTKPAHRGRRPFSLGTTCTEPVLRNSLVLLDLWLGAIDHQ